MRLAATVSITATVSLAAALTPAAASASAITIDPGAYAGRYVIDNATFGAGVMILDLAPGTHVFDDGYEIGGSGFLFDVDATGNVTHVVSPAAAHGAGATLAIANTTIT